MLNQCCTGFITLSVWARNPLALAVGAWGLRVNISANFFVEVVAKYQKNYYSLVSCQHLGGFTGNLDFHCLFSAESASCGMMIYYFISLFVYKICLLVYNIRILSRPPCNVS